MVRLINERPIRPRTRLELEEAIEEAWGGITMDLITTLYDSIPRRLQEVIDAQGGATKY